MLAYESLSLLMMWYMICSLVKLWASSWCDIWYAHSWSYELSPDVIYDMLTREVMSFLLMWYTICSLMKLYELSPVVIYDMLTHEVMSFPLMWYMICSLVKLWTFSWCDIRYAHLWSYELSPVVIYDMLTRINILLMWYAHSFTDVPTSI